MPEVQAETQFLVIPFGVLVDYFDPTFFNAWGPALKKKMAIPIVALLPNIKESFSSHPDECLSDSAFNQKYGNDILALYKFDDRESWRRGGIE